MLSQNELDLLLEKLERLLANSRGGDAIDTEIRSAPRVSAAASIRDHQAVRQFREEMRDGLIRLDTANQLLGLLRSVLEVAETP